MAHTHQAFRQRLECEIGIGRNEIKVANDGFHGRLSKQSSLQFGLQALLNQAPHVSFGFWRAMAPAGNFFEGAETPFAQARLIGHATHGDTGREWGFFFLQLTRSRLLQTQLSGRKTRFQREKAIQHSDELSTNSASLSRTLVQDRA
jgi:hypothetical protein